MINAFIRFFLQTSDHVMTAYSRESGSGLFSELCYFDTCVVSHWVHNELLGSSCDRAKAMQLTKNGYRQNAKVDIARCQDFFLISLYRLELRKTKSLNQIQNGIWEIPDIILSPLRVILT